MSDDGRQTVSLFEVVAVLTALVAGGLGGAGVAAARAAFGRPVTLALVLAYAAIGAGGAIGSLVVDLLGLHLDQASPRRCNGAGRLASRVRHDIIRIAQISGFQPLVCG